MITSKEGLLEICSYEGCCLTPYYDSVGVLTVGFGLTNSDRVVKLGEVYTMQEVIDMFKEDIRKYEKVVNDFLRVPVTQTQFDALVSFDFNTGGFHGSTARLRINSGDTPQEVCAALMLWNKPPEVIKRRQNECHLYETGYYTNNGTTLLYDVDQKGHIIFSSGRDVSIGKYFL